MDAPGNEVSHVEGERAEPEESGRGTASACCYDAPWPTQVMEQQALLPLVERTVGSLTASFEPDGAEYRASLSIDQGLGLEADCLLALGLLPAMATGRRLSGGRGAAQVGSRFGPGRG